MTVHIKSQTTEKDEAGIGHTAERMQRKGYRHVVVYRNALEVGLSTAALGSTRLTEEFQRAVSANQKCCVVGFKNREDEQKIRQKVENLKELAFKP